MSPGLSTRHVGNELTVSVEEMIAGNFSCHLRNDGRYLNHTLVLVQLNPDDQNVLLKNLNVLGEGGLGGGARFFRLDI